MHGDFLHEIGVRPSRPDPLGPRALLATGVAGLVALVLFTASVRPYPVAGTSARTLVQHLWLSDFPAATHFGWGIICRALASLSPSHSVLILNLFSAFCGAAAVWLMCTLNLWILRAVSPGHRRSIHLVSAGGAGLYIALSAPMWLISSRAHPMAFDVLLLLGSLALLLDYHRKGRVSRLYAFGFLYGFGLVEYAGFAWFAFGVIPLTAYVMLRRGHLFGHQAILGVAWVALGLSTCVIGVWSLLGSPAALWMDDMTPFGLLRTMLSALWGQFRLAMSSTGWMIGALISVPPFLVCLGQAAEQTTAQRRISSFLLYIATTVLLLLVAFRTPLSPWYYHREQLVTLLPYVLMSTTFALTLNWWLGVSASLSEGSHRLGRVATMAVAVLLVVCVIGAGVSTYPVIRSTYAGSLYVFASRVLDAMGARTLLVTDGSLDDLFRIAAREQGRDLVVLSIPENENTACRSALATHFSSPRLQGLARVGLLPLLREILGSDPETSRQLVIQPADYLWREAGFRVLPDTWVYLGSTSEFGSELDTHVRRNEAFWRMLIPALERTASKDPLRAPLARHLLRHLSKVANDLGVCLQREGREALARQAYETALAAEAENVSALANLQSLTGELDSEEIAAAILDLHLSPMALLSRHGAIYNPGAIQDAMPRSVTDAQPIPEDLRQALVSVSEVYAAGEAGRCLEMLNDLSITYPTRPPVWYFRGTLAAETRNADVWAQCWEFMTDHGIEWPDFLLIQAQRFAYLRRLDDALKLYDRLLDLKPFHEGILNLATRVAFAAGDMVRLDRFATRLLSLNPTDPWGNYALGTMQLQRGEYDLAESSYRVAVPSIDIPYAANNLAWLLLMRGAYDEALTTIKRALEVDPDCAAAWDTQGMALLRLGRPAEAMASLDQALALRPGDWDARLHTSMALSGLDRRDEAVAILEDMASAVAQVPDAKILEYDSFRKRIGLAPVRQ